MLVPESHSSSPVSPYITMPGPNITFNRNVTLAGDVYAMNVVIESGVTVYTVGYNFYVKDSFINHGMIVTGPSILRNYPESYGGSGGGGLSSSNNISAGYSTRASGGQPSFSNYQNGSSGYSVPLPGIDNNLLQAWHSKGMEYFLAGAAGGSGMIMQPGGGAYGIYIQARLLYAGQINARGSYGNGLSDFAGYGFGLYSGGGGGGVILLSSGPGGYVQGNYSVEGGAGAYNQNTHSGLMDFYYTSAGSGGNGQAADYNYSTAGVPVAVTHYTGAKVYAPMGSLTPGSSVKYNAPLYYRGGQVGTYVYSYGVRNVSGPFGTVSMGIYYNIKYSSGGGQGSGGQQSVNGFYLTRLPFLQEYQLHDLSLGIIPSDSFLQNGTVKAGVPYLSSYGIITTYQVTTPHSEWWVSETTGLLIAVAYHERGTHLNFTVAKTNIINMPGSALPLVLTVSAAIALAVTVSAAVLYARKAGKKEPAVNNDRDRNKVKSEYIEALYERGIIGEEDKKESPGLIRGDK